MSFVSALVRRAKAAVSMILGGAFAPAIACAYGDDFGSTSPQRLASGYVRQRATREPIADIQVLCDGRDLGRATFSTRSGYFETDNGTPKSNRNGMYYYRCHFRDIYKTESPPIPDVDQDILLNVGAEQNVVLMGNAGPSDASTDRTPLDGDTEAHGHDGSADGALLDANRADALSDGSADRAVSEAATDVAPSDAALHDVGRADVLSDGSADRAMSEAAAVAAPSDAEECDAELSDADSDVRSEQASDAHAYDEEGESHPTDRDVGIGEN